MSCNFYNGAMTPRQERPAGSKPAAKQNKGLKSVYLIHGDKKIIEEALARLKKRVSAQFDLEFNYDQFNGASTAASEIIYSANTLPFMSEKRLVVVKDADKLPAADIAQLVKYVEKPSETTCLVLVANTVSKSSKLYKAVDKNGEVAEYKLSVSPQTWIKKEFKDRGILVSDSVARYLTHVVGSDLQRLTVEIEKISLFVSTDRIIEPSEIDLVISKTTETSIFNLSDAIGERNPAKAISILHSLFQQKEAPLSILAIIARHYRMLLRTKVWVEDGRDNKYVIDHLTGEEGKKLPPFVISKYRDQSYNFSVTELEEMFEKLLRADLDLKSSSKPAEAVLENCII
ncbi:MAG: DNA polymerase III subunit delta [Rubrobacteridae bacterium]|nr:DNA polymerase III subunit delta [Rubrobacteridae bacterium]